MDVRKNSISNNININCNSVEINSKVNRETDHYIFGATNNGFSKNELSKTDSSQEPTNSSFSNNHFFGSGNVRYFYNMGQGWNLNSGKFDTSGNVFDLDHVKGVEYNF